MTKAEIINKVSESTGMSRKDAIVALEIFLSSIKEGLKSGEKVSLVGFGTFYVKHKRWSTTGSTPARTTTMKRATAKSMTSNEAPSAGLIPS
jgi:DNA-binding protein HU-beta